MSTKENMLTEWNIVSNEKVELKYTDGSTLYVSKADFDRAFGNIIRLTKEVCEKEYAIMDL